MNFKAISGAAALGLAMLAAAPAHAITLTNTDGTMAWTGFDWDSNGTAYTTGFQPIAGKTFSIDVFAWAGNLKNGATNINNLHLDNNADGVSAGAGFYEYTVHAKLQESVVGCSGTQCTFQVNSGTFDIFYDTTPDANALAGSLGTGFLDGVKIIAGTFGSQAGGTFTVANGSDGFGITSLQGAVGFTDTTYINPALSTSTVTTTLQLGGLTTNNWVSPGGFNGVAFPGGNDVVFQADANQSFAANVPEPASLALVASALLAGGYASRRRSKK